MSWQGLCELASMVQNGETTSTALVRDALARIKTVDAGIINSVVVLVDEDKVFQRAAEIDGLSPGEKVQLPLAGVPITIKEHLNVAGLPTTMGDPSSCRDPVKHSAGVVRALEDAGAIVIGKTNTPIFCADYQSYNAVYGRTNNPHDLLLSPGGSSGGSAAAVAAGLVPLCIGTDIGGSVRVPAHCCGVFAHKPTWGVISKDNGGLPSAAAPPKAMSTTGPIARRAKDLTVVTRLLFANAREPFGGLAHAAVVPETNVEDLRGLKVAVWDDDPVCPVDEAVSSAMRATVELLQTNGAIVTFAKPNVDSYRLLDCYRGLVEDAMEGTNGTRSHAVHLEQSQVQCEIRAAFDEFFRGEKKIDVLLTPTFPVVAFPHTMVVDDDAHHPFYRTSSRTLSTVRGKTIPYHLGCFWPAIANLTLLPATAFPVQAETPDELPVALQLVGRELADGTCLKVAELLEEAGGKDDTTRRRVAQFRIPVRLQE